MTLNNPNVTWLRDPGHFLSLGFGSGLAPKAPGTFGTVAAIVVYLPMTLLSTPVILCGHYLVVFFRDLVVRTYGDPVGYTRSRVNCF